MQKKPDSSVRQGHNLMFQEIKIIKNGRGVQRGHSARVTLLECSYY